MAGTSAEQFAVEIARIAEEQQAEQIVVMDLRRISPVTDYFVICSGTSERQRSNLCDLIREYGMEAKVLVPSFRDGAMQEFRQTCPEVATAASEDEVREFVIRGFLLMAGTITPEYQALQVPETRDGIPIVTRLFLWFARNRNVEVHIWTINEPEDMQRFIDKGLDGIMTDRTDTLLEILGR